VPELVPIRHERMATSPFAFYRGAANVLASDLADQPSTGLTVQLCGDAHLANFGGFASPERSLVFDINDFDETLPGPFEWDVKRLVASFEVAARSNGLDEIDREKVVAACAKAYCKAISKFSRMGHLELWYSRFTVEEIALEWSESASPAAADRFAKNIRKAKAKDNLKAKGRLTEIRDGVLRFRSDPPLLVPLHEILPSDVVDEMNAFVNDAVDSYRRTLLRDRRILLERYRLVDVARKVVGVGSG
jgi:hypothetical protein